MITLDLLALGLPNCRKHPLRAVLLFVWVLLVTFAASSNRAAIIVAPESLSAFSDQANVLRSEWREPSLRAAIAKYREGAEQAQAVGNHESAAEMAKNAGDVYFLLSEYQNALEQYRNAQSSWTRAGNRSRAMRASNLVGYVYVYLSKSKMALDLARAALNYYQRHDSEDGEILLFKAEAENCVGEANASFSNLHTSIKHFERALDLWSRANDKKGQALAILNLAYAYGDLGDIHRTHDLFDKSLSLYQGEGDKRGEARVLTAKGTLYSFLGQKQKALDAHLKATEILRRIGDHAGEAIALNSIGKAYEDLNDLPTALSNYKQALQLYQQQGNIEFASATKYYIGRAYNLMGDHGSAVRFLNESVADSKLVGQRRVMAFALSEIAQIQNEKGEQDEARIHLQQAIRLYRSMADRRGLANALTKLATIHHTANQNAKALIYYKQALDLYVKAGDKHSEAAILYQIAVVEAALGNLTNALTHVKESNEAIEVVRSQIISPELRASYYASVRKHAELLIDLQMRLGKLDGDKSAAETAFETSEHAHARSLLEVLGEASAQIRQGVNPSLLEQEQVLQQKLYALAFHKMRLLQHNPEPHELELVAQDIAALTTSYRELQTQIKQQSPRYANLVQPQPLSLKRMQAELPDGTLLLEYTLGSERSYLWAITNNSLTVYTLAARDEIEKLVKSVCELIIARQRFNESDLSSNTPQVAQADAEYWQQAGRLSEILLGPAADLMKGKTILVVADGALHYLPFDALPSPSKTDDQRSSEPVPLIVDHEIGSLPSASILATIRQTAPSGPSDKLIAILADPVFSANDSRVRNVNPAESQQSFQLTDGISLSRLPATQDEAQSIMKIVPAGTGIMATGFDADRKMALSSELGQYKVVHFATHGVVDVNNPEMSGIVLSLVGRDGKSTEGFVQLHDIYNMNLSNTQLVVLSACETALGKQVRGEGLVGLSRGFIYAGASSVVATLWKVDDRATTQLMTQFYKGLFEERLTASAALRKAKVNMLQQPRYRAPFFWAAFNLQGEYRDKIAMPQRTGFVTSKLLLTGLISFGVLSLIIIMIKRRARRSHV